MSYADDLFDAGVRVERVIWLPGAVCAEAPPDDFEELLSDIDADPAATIFEALPELRAIADSEDYSAELAMEYLTGATGFLVQGASPVRTYMEGGSYYSGWGHYRTKWFRLASEADFAPAVIAWAETMAEKDRAKAGAE